MALANVVQRISLPNGWHDGDVILNRFKIVGELGSGGFGQVLSVCEYTDNSSSGEQRSKVYALKFDHRMSEGLASKEARVYSILNKELSPFFCQMIAYDSWFDIPFIVIEQMDCSLHQVTSDMFPHKPRMSTCLSVCDQLFKGLEILHRYNIIHFDIKPANILCSYQQNVVKLCDFGSAFTFKQKPIPQGESAPSNFDVGGCTTSFASLNIAQKLDPSFRDDAIMICYSVIYFTTQKNEFWDIARKANSGECLLRSRRGEKGVNELIAVFDRCSAMRYGQRVDFIELGICLAEGGKDVMLQWVEEANSREK